MTILCYSQIHESMLIYLATWMLDVVFDCIRHSSTHSIRAPLHQLIDQHIDKKIAEQKLAVSVSADDAEFLRRVYLDLTGVIPGSKSLRDFLQDRGPNKRQQTIDRLLASDAHARHMATVFDVLLMERRPDKYVTTPEWREYLQRSFASHKPLNELVGEILGADGVDAEQRPAAKFFLDRAVDKDVLVKDIGRLFLGMNLQCAQCHDHPDIDGYLHKYYHGLSVFVAGSKTFRQPDGKFVLQETVIREIEFASVFAPDNTQKTGPRIIEALLEVQEFPEGEEYVEKPSRTVRSVPKFSLRELLAKRLPSNTTPEFARNFANRLWAMMMGRGLVHPLDMHHADNPASHPELLKTLTDHLMNGKYDTKVLLREIALSNAYQRSSIAPEGVDAQTIPPESFAMGNMKGLTPEQLFESLLVAAQSSAILEKQIDDSLIEEEAENKKSDEEPDEANVAIARQEKRAERVAEFVSIFGSVPGQAVGEFSSSLPQALFIANSETVAEWIPPRLGNLTERLIALKDSNEIADELYTSVLSRQPTTAERQFVSDELNKTKLSREKSVTPLVWALIASAEFRLNH